MAQGYVYKIWYQSKFGKEEIDSTHDRDNARYLVEEYRLAFGANQIGSACRVWKTFEKES